MITKCPKCEKEFDNYSKWGAKKFCSRACANSRTHTNEVKSKISKSLSGKKLSSEQRAKRRKKITYDQKKFCLHCDIPLPDKKTGKFCSINCWVQNVAQNRTAFQNYKSKCQFVFDIKEYNDIFDMSLVHQYGWYSPSNKGNNLNGVSKDHLFSVKQGFVENVDPYYISHPANCNLVLHKDNQRKRAKCSISLEELIEKVEKFDRERGGMVTQRIANP
jgi:hypothetical protein